MGLDFAWPPGEIYISQRLIRHSHRLRTQFPVTASLAGYV